mgnify:CR=1 FL=1
MRISLSRWSVAVLDWSLCLIMWSIVAVLMMAGCATLGSVSDKAERLTRAAVVATEQAHATGTMTDTQFKGINVELHQVALGGLTFTKLLRAGQAKPADLVTFLDLIVKQTRIIQRAYPSTPYVTEVVKYLDALARLVAGVLPKLQGATS